MKKLAVVLFALCLLLPIASELHHYRIVSNDVDVTVKHVDGTTSHVRVKNLRTNGGADFFSSQLLGTSAAGAQANYIALSTDTAAASASDTVLASEINNTNALGRAQGSITHTASAASSVVSHTWTYTGSSSVQVNKVALFTASSGGTMVFEALLPYPQTVNQNGDQITINYTVNF